VLIVKADVAPEILQALKNLQIVMAMCAQQES
jgi:hypothetical protein